MKRQPTVFLICFQFFLLSSINFSQAQINIQTGSETSPVDMVENIIGEGIFFDNVVFQGADISRGIFTNGDSTNLGLGSGIFLTSGSGLIIPGPNNSGSAGLDNGLPGNATLNSITISTTHDASVLEFDFVPVSDTLKFRYVFGSEEYSEYVNSAFYDVFGFFISGPNPQGGYYADKNMAIIPGTTNDFVSINNVNNGWAQNGVIPTGPCTNCEFFHDNTGGLTLQYDGLTTVLTAWIPVVHCETYHLKLGVADAGDGIFDSGIFIEENSITSPAITTDVHLIPPDITDHMVEGHVEADIVFQLPDPSYAPLTLNLDLSLSSAIPAAYPAGDFLEEIPTTIDFNGGQDSAVVHINAVPDGILEGDEYLLMIIENNLGCMAFNDTLELLIEEYIDMASTTSPNLMICSGQEVDLWTTVYNGFPPYTYLWEPGGFTTDTISVSPEESTTYKVVYHDVFMESDSNTIVITVMPLNYNILDFSFNKENNPQLPWDVSGQLFEDSISLDVPVGTNINHLIATYNLSENAWAEVNGVLQESGVTVNDFTSPVTYHVIAPGGCAKDWVVNVNLITGNQQGEEKTISVYPNPVNDQLFISNAAGFEVSIMNNLGKKIFKTRIDKENYSLDVNAFDAGIYYLQFSLDEIWFVRKFVVRR